jgi:HD-GYP domain-containing protein (c-di-GMP phosphodiesterase class II)
MTQIADVYDALRTYRPYRPSLDRETALGILREGRGTEFEPVFLDRFLEMVSWPSPDPDDARDPGTPPIR